MKHLLFLFAFLIVVGAGCVQATIESDVKETVTESKEDILDLDDVEDMTIAEEDLKVNKNFELSNHTTYFASSPDGIEWTLREEPVAHYASVPELVALEEDLGPFPAGTLLAYFVDGTQDHGREDVELGLVYSLDNGQTWSDRLYTSMEGMPDGTVAVDPSLVVLSDASLRLYYYDFPAMLPAPGVGGSPSGEPSAFYSATSTDGIHFAYEGIVYQSETLVTDPDVIQVGSAWYMYFMSHGDASMMVSVSEDPLGFSSKEKVNNNGIPGVIVVGDEVWLFSCGQSGITRLTSLDGLAFTEVDASAVFVENGVHCDPSVVQLNDGSYGMVLKHIQAQDLKQPQQR